MNEIWGLSTQAAFLTQPFPIVVEPNGERDAENDSEACQ